MPAADTPIPMTEKVSYRRLWWVGLLAIAAALAANAVIWAVANRVLEVDPGFTPLASPSFVGLTLVGVLGAVAAFAIVGRIARRPIRTFHIVAFVALLVSFLPDIALLVARPYPGSELSNVSVLMLMHVVAYAVSVGLLTRLGREKGEMGPSLQRLPPREPRL